MTFEEMLTEARRPKERRERIAVAAVTGMAARGSNWNERECEQIAKTAVRLADALRAELDRPA